MALQASQEKGGLGTRRGVAGAVTLQRRGERQARPQRRCHRPEVQQLGLIGRGQRFLRARGVARDGKRR